MDRRERFESLIEAVLAAQQGHQADIWTSLPGIIQSFDAAQRTCTVQPTIQARIENPDTGAYSWVSLPLLLDCPVIFPGGGGCTLTFPLAAGDECLVSFSSRCIDAWWNSGKISRQAIVRMHDLSDGFVIPGPRSLPNVEPAISTTRAQFRTKAGTTVIELDPASDNVNIVCAGQANITAPTVNIGSNGQTLQKLVTAAFEALFNAHVHTSSAPGVATTAPLTPMTSAQLTTTINGG